MLGSAVHSVTPKDYEQQHCSTFVHTSLFLLAMLLLLFLLVCSCRSGCCFEFQIRVVVVFS